MMQPPWNRWPHSGRAKAASSSGSHANDASIHGSVIGKAPMQLNGYRGGRTGRVPRSRFRALLDRDEGAARRLQALKARGLCPREDSKIVSGTSAETGVWSTLRCCACAATSGTRRSRRRAPSSAAPGTTRSSAPRGSTGASTATGSATSGWCGAPTAAPSSAAGRGARPRVDAGYPHRGKGERQTAAQRARRPAPLRGSLVLRPAFRGRYARTTCASASRASRPVSRSGTPPQDPRRRGARSTGRLRPPDRAQAIAPVAEPLLVDPRGLEDLVRRRGCWP